MSDPVNLTRLAEAVEVVERHKRGGTRAPRTSQRHVDKAARVFLKAPKVWWCAEHEASWPDSSVDYCHATFDDGETCRMVRVAVVPVEEE